MWCWGDQISSMRRLLEVGFALPALLCLIVSDAQTQDFASGQIWTYKDAVPATSRVIIGRIDIFPGDRTVISVSITDAPIPTTTEPLQTISHLPFDEGALRQSVEKQVGVAMVPSEFAEGYQLWREEYDRGDAGTFTIPVAEAVEYIKQAVTTH